MATASLEIIWLQQLLWELGVILLIFLRPTLFYADNTSAIHISMNPVFHEQTKHKG